MLGLGDHSTERALVSLATVRQLPEFKSAQPERQTGADFEGILEFSIQVRAGKALDYVGIDSFHKWAEFPKARPDRTRQPGALLAPSLLAQRLQTLDGRQKALSVLDRSGEHP